MLYELVMGDWSHDGHNQTDKVVIEASTNQLSLDHSNGIKKLVEEHGEWVTKALENLCSDYEGSVFPVQLREALVTSGLDLDTLEGDAWGEREYPRGQEPYTIPNTPGSLSSDDFAEIYMFIAKLGNPALEYERANAVSLNIGGYGLFYG